MIHRITALATGVIIAPLVTSPDDKDVAKNEWGYGLAGAIANSSGKWFYGLLLTGISIR